MNELSWSITDLVARQRDGEVTAEEILIRALRRIGDDNSRAIVAMDPEAANAAALRADRARAAGVPLGPLHGVPLTIKDSFAVAGMHQCEGTAESSRKAFADAPAVRRLREAGAIIVGKTNVSERLSDLQSQNPVHGRTVNPHHPERTSGGSSGGSAAAVAARLVWGDLGSDLAGSIRVPAAWCGVFGHRPSNGIVSKRGHLPWPVWARLDVTASAAGPFARTAADLRTLLRVLVGAGGLEDRVWRVDLPQPSARTLGGVRVGVWTERTLPVDDEQSTALDALITELAAHGCAVTAIDGSPLATSEAQELYQRLIAHEIAWTSSEVTPAPVTRVYDDLERQRELRERWEALLTDIDVVVAPVVPHVAPPHSEETLSSQIGAWSTVANLGMGPSTVVPLGTGTSGMPVAIQVIGHYGGDLTTIRFAELLEQAGLARAPRPRTSLAHPKRRSSSS